MNEQTVKILKGICALLAFAVCLALVITGQRQIGPLGLLIMLTGLAGLIILLWLYNRQYR